MTFEELREHYGYYCEILTKEEVIDFDVIDAIEEVNNVEYYIIACY